MACPPGESVDNVTSRKFDRYYLGVTAREAGPVWLTVDDVAAFFGRTREWVFEQIRHGALRGHECGVEPRFTITDVMRLYAWHLSRGGERLRFPPRQRPATG